MINNERIKLTPMMAQWQNAKHQYQDAILLFRMGDFYELFGDDAIKAAPILELALTSRDKDKSGFKMAGFPFHAADSYIAKLVEYGHKVAICDQLEDPKLSRGIVKRGITNVITPGTIIDIENHVSGELSYLVGVACDSKDLALCALDLATGIFQVTSSTSKEKLIDEAVRLLPNEVVVLSKDQEAQAFCAGLALAIKNKKTLRIEKKEQLLKNIGKSYLASFAESIAEQEAALLVLSYLYELKGALPSHIEYPRRYSIDDQLLMDESSRLNLDLFPRKKGDKHNLFSVLDDTKTAMGKRALYRAIKGPSTSMKEIVERHEMVGELCANPKLCDEIRDILAACYDIEKLTALLASNKIGPLGMAHLRDSIAGLEKIKVNLSCSNSLKLKNFFLETPDISHLQKDLSHALVDDPPISLRDKDIFREGYNNKLDELKKLRNNSQEMLLELEAKERQETGISSLKIKYTRVFGYYIEITKSNLNKVPAHYQRKQTIANGERFVTSELHELEIKMRSAEEDTLTLEENLFFALKEKIAEEAPKIISVGRKIALLDLITTFSKLALVKSWVRPKMLEPDAGIIDIKEGRHPIAEDICLSKGTYFVPNNIALSTNDCSILLITGPNMAGKSTIMRQVALIQLMAQMGSFVPASAATLSMCDAIFARVGANDDLSTGRSTFMVEMSETASILNNATINSLILLDEIGRGTSTYDGLSIAQAVAEYIHDELKSRTLFATHYHELTKLDSELKRLKNFHVEIVEKDKEIKFLYTLGVGPCLKSFGIQVANLSGLPNTVLMRASEVLKNLEQKKAMSCNTPSKKSQLNLFNERNSDLPLEHIGLYKKMLSIEIDKTTPLQALNKLASWQNELKMAVLRRV